MPPLCTRISKEPTQLFPLLGIPRSTAASWIRRGSRDIVTTELFAEDEFALRARVLKLERRVRVLLGIVRLLFVVVRLFGLRLDFQRVPSGETKSSILAAIDRAKGNMPVGVALRVLGLSVSRYHTWRRLEQACNLEDRSSCPRTFPNQLTRQEIATIQQMATSMDHRHMPNRALALYAQRIGKVFAAPATWGRLIRDRGWRRPRQRVYPVKPKDGIRAAGSGELLHIDVTVSGNRPMPSRQPQLPRVTSSVGSTTRSRSSPSILIPRNAKASFASEGLKAETLRPIYSVPADNSVSFRQSAII